MSRFNITTTTNGKCDITITIFNKENTIIANRSSTYDVKPTVKELKEQYKSYKKQGGRLIRISTMPSGATRTYNL
ncbi:MAG: hypothetical protein E6R13_00590 [Spirochaetes bacterium]|nr:MAG: hypothetical protein E6R13_00590 [Spirochaetota bacterium]